MSLQDQETLKGRKMILHHARHCEQTLSSDMRRTKLRINEYERERERERARERERERESICHHMGRVSV